MVYLDTSASAKLVLAEPETAALETFLRSQTGALLTSRVGIVELRRAASRDALARSRSDAVVAALTVLELDPTIGTIAAELDPTLRTLDAIHLASALAVGDELSAFVCYDTRLAEAARAGGLRVVAPR